MRKILVFLIFALMFISFTAAETTIIFNKEIEPIYNLGDIINVPVTVKTTADTYGIFQMDLICGGTQINFYKNGVGLVAGEEKRMESSLVLMKSLILNLKGKCKLKASIEDTYILSNEFTISDILNLELSSDKIDFLPEEEIIIEGHAIKENEKYVNGFIEANLIKNNSENISYMETIQNGFFSIKFSLPKETKAGQYLVKLNAYEKDILGEKTNTGFMNYNIKIGQVPTSLEIVLENSEIEPGTNAKIKATLYDQTGEKIINTTAKIIIRDKEDLPLEQKEVQVNEVIEFPTKYNDPIEEFKVLASSNGLETESSFKIIEKEDIGIEVTNRTLTITNTGNVPYCNKTILIKVGEEALNINDLCLEIDESQKYQLSAPDGEYQVEIITEQGTEFSENVALTGKAIDVQKAKSTFSKVKYWFVWIFIIAILGFATFIIFKKIHKKKFFAHMPSLKNIHFKKHEKEETVPLKKSSNLNSKNKAELSLSIKGQKQSSSIICIKIKNLNEINSSKSNIKETIQKIIETAEDEKAATYENQNNLFFILAPTKTKTFKNERTAVKIAQKIKAILDEHNKLAKEKIDFGISLNYGEIIAKQEGKELKFMSIGTLISGSKKIAEISKNEILLGEKINNRLKADVKTEKDTANKIPVYKIKEVKNKEKHEKFLKSFLNNLDK